MSILKIFLFIKAIEPILYFLIVTLVLTVMYLVCLVVDRIKEITSNK